MTSNPHDSVIRDSRTGQAGLSQETLEKFTPILRTLQIIVVAMLMGTVVFLVVVLLNPAEDPKPGVLTYAALGLMAVMLIMRLIVPGLMAAAARRRIAAGEFHNPAQTGAQQQAVNQMLEETGQAGQLMLTYQVRTIVGAAVVEAAAFLLLVAYMMEGSLLTLVGAAVMMALIALHFPTSSRVSNWIARQLETIETEQLRHDSG